jgi:predicted TPR repeat methyltransferase
MSNDIRDTTMDPREIFRPNEQAVNALTNLASLPPDDLRQALEFLKATGHVDVDLKIKAAVEGLFDGVEHGA